MNLRNALDSLSGSEMERIILYKDGKEIYNGTIFSLRETREDLLNYTLRGDVEFEINRGYCAELL